MKRGEIVLVAAPGDFGKPRPAVVVQADALTDAGISSILICLITSHLTDAPLFRIRLEPADANGLRKPSDIMTDKVLAVSRERIDRTIGSLDSTTLVRLNRTLAFVMGLG